MPMRESQNTQPSEVRFRVRLADEIDTKLTLA